MTQLEIRKQLGLPEKKTKRPPIFKSQLEAKKRKKRKLKKRL